jgi:hypothetical protein
MRARGRCGRVERHWGPHEHDPFLGAEGGPGRIRRLTLDCDQTRRASTSQSPSSPLSPEKQTPQVRTAVLPRGRLGFQIVRDAGPQSVRVVATPPQARGTRPSGDLLRILAFSPTSSPHEGATARTAAPLTLELVRAHPMPLCGPRGRNLRATLGPGRSRRSPLRLRRGGDRRAVGRRGPCGRAHRNESRD